MIPIGTAMTFGAAKFASTAIFEGAIALYGTTKYINDFINEHIEEMKGAENPIICRTGRILDMAKQIDP